MRHMESAVLLSSVSRKTRKDTVIERCAEASDLPGKAQP